MTEFRFDQNTEPVPPYSPGQTTDLGSTSPRPIQRSRHVTYACICLHLSSFLYALLAVGFPALVMFGVASEKGATREDLFVVALISIFLFAFSVGLVAIVELVAWALRRGKKWGWIGAMVLFGVYIPSLFLPLGAIGMWALLQEDVRREYMVS